MWIEFLPIRNIKNGILGDIRSHLPQNQPYTSEQCPPNGLVTEANYTELSTPTKVHEGTHGVNSLIRNKHGGNAAYLLKNKAFVHPEPNLKLETLAKLVPHELRGSGYSLYMIQQQRWWNDHPLYIIDELSAYLNGTKAYLEYNSSELNIVYSCQLTIEFLGYLAILVGEVQIDELNAFMRVIYEEVLNLISSIFRRKYGVNKLYNQLDIVEKYMDHPLDYIMI